MRQGEGRKGEWGREGGKQAHLRSAPRSAGQPGKAGRRKLVTGWHIFPCSARPPLVRPAPHGSPCTWARAVMPEPGLGSSLVIREAGDPGPDDTPDPRVSNRSQGSGASPSPAALHWFTSRRHHSRWAPQGLSEGSSCPGSLIKQLF